MTRRSSPVLMAVCLGLLAVLAALWLAPGPVAAWRQWQTPAPQVPNLSDIQAALLVSSPAATAVYPSIAERPLFLPSRKPEAVASAGDAAAPPPTAIEQITLLGIVAGPTLRGVLLEEKGKPRFVRTGELVGEWSLNAIDGRQVTFVRGAETKQIELRAHLQNLSDKNASNPAATLGANVQTGNRPPSALPPQMNALGSANPGGRQRPPRPMPNDVAARTSSDAAAPGADAAPAAAFGGSVAPPRTSPTGESR